MGNKRLPWWAWAVIVTLFVAWIAYRLSTA